jgi:1,4-dihydroxy-2-naphthoate polyprenyltransferase
MPCAIQTFRAPRKSGALLFVQHYNLRYTRINMDKTAAPNNLILSWLTLLRLGATARGVLPFFLGGVIAWSQGYQIDWRILVLSSAAVIAVMLMTFLVNEYYDYETDAANQNYHKLSGGSRVLPMGFIPRRHALIATYVCTAIAVGIGLWLYLAFKTGPLTIPMGALAIVIGYTYTAKSFKLSYRGWGELSIWFACGWLATIMGYYLQTGEITWLVSLVSLPGAFSVFSVILINEAPDVVSDAVYGKKNLVVRLGTIKATRLYFSGLVVSLAGMAVLGFTTAPRTSAYLAVLLVPLLIWIYNPVRTHGLGDNKFQESLSIRTMLYDHLVTIIYAVSFIVEGFKLSNPSISQLYLLAGAFIFVFAMEGMSLVFAKATLRTGTRVHSTTMEKTGSSGMSVPRDFPSP